ncbi:MAG: FAD-dependent thymidylate synthase [Bacteroidaceae bacterium]|nr:FAD-dependent thymidylate synthase [Bacteroidaceae bacterium]
MIIIKPEVNVPVNELSNDILRKLERYGRVCYKSENLMEKSNANQFIQSKLELGHESIIEHEKATVMFIVDRGISHEIVRHRIAAYSQESTRYCNYSKDKFGNEITVIEPFFFVGKPAYETWKE